MDGNGQQVTKPVKGILRIPVSDSDTQEINLDGLNVVNETVRLVKKLRDSNVPLIENHSKFKTLIEAFDINYEYNAPIYITLTPVLQVDTELRDMVSQRLDISKLSTKTTHRFGQFRALVQSGIISRDSDVYQAIANDFVVPHSVGHVQELIEPKNWLKHAFKSGIFEANDRNREQFWMMMQDRYFVNSYFSDSVIEALNETGLMLGDAEQALKYVESFDLGNERDKMILKKFVANNAFPQTAQEKALAAIAAHDSREKLPPILDL